MFPDGETAPLMAVTKTLRENGSLEEIGSHSFLCALIDAVPTTVSVAHHAWNVKTAALARRAFDVARELAQAAKEGAPWHRYVTTLVELRAEDPRLGYPTERVSNAKTLSL